MKNKTFATAINCMDGRTQEPVTKFLKKKFSVNYVDAITEPGPDKILAQNKNKQAVTSIRNRVKISTQKHNSKVIAVVGHYSCAGHPVDKSKHIEDVMKSVAKVYQWGLAPTILGLWVNKDWKVEEVILVK